MAVGIPLKIGRCEAINTLQGMKVHVYMIGDGEGNTLHHDLMVY